MAEVKGVEEATLEDNPLTKHPGTLEVGEIKLELTPVPKAGEEEEVVVRVEVVEVTIERELGTPR